MRRGERVVPRVMEDRMFGGTTEVRIAGFWRRVDRTSHAPCWTWTGPVNDNGYGKWHASKQLRTSAHRYSYLVTIGPVEDGLKLDHLCRNRLCVNPQHMEPVTHSENVRRGYEARRRGAA